MSGEREERLKRRNDLKTKTVEITAGAGVMATQDTSTSVSTTLASILERLDAIDKNVKEVPDIHEKLNSISSDITDICVKQASIEKKVDGMDTRIDTLESQCHELKHANAIMKRKLNEQSDRNIMLESHMRRNNLLFGNISESSPEKK
jgi:septal ring factor EnvC (AmiA/AmiB activator)